MLNKVPQVTIHFWIIKVLATTVGETAADWRATLEGAIALGVRHVSAYALTIEPATPLGINLHDADSSVLIGCG